ncbi:hypothetical protein MMC31_003531, partial [Peltigera leucophlebia]|nr:hypothetical protein [Peltigera leucophlebia]
RKKHHQGTGGWLINEADFEEWKKTPGSLLWLYGIPGCGKTILRFFLAQSRCLLSILTGSSSVVIEHMKTYCASNPNLAIAYFYFDFNEPGKQNATNFVSTLIAQLCSHLAELPEELTKLYKTCNNGTHEAVLYSLQTVLFAVAKNFDTVFIVADALDECPIDGKLREELLDLIKDMSTQSSSNVHLLVTSRAEQDISERLFPLSTTRAISIQSSKIDSDIKSYICHEISKDSKLKSFPAGQQENIQRTLLAGANGMFRWVFCQLDVLKKYKNPSALGKALKSLPETLHETYDRILLNIDVDYQEMARCALIWLAFSKRPLTIKEVAEAAILNPEQDPAFDPENKFLNPSIVLGILGSLVTYSPERILPSVENNADLTDDEPFHLGGGPSIESNTFATEDSSSKVIRLAHFSVREYLISKGIQDSKASKFGITENFADLFIAESCLQYIFYYHESGLKATPVEILEKFPLLKYACRFYIHTKTSLPESQKAGNSVQRLCLSDTAFLSWLRVHHTLDDEGIRFERLTDVATPLHLATYMGFARERGQGQWKNKKGTNSAASGRQKGHAAIAKLLLEKKAEVNGKSKWEASALHLATKYGHEAVVRLLLDQGAEVDPEWVDETPLFLAASKMNKIIVKLLLAKGAGDDKVYKRVQLPTLS